MCVLMFVYMLLPWTLSFLSFIITLENFHVHKKCVFLCFHAKQLSLNCRKLIALVKIVHSFLQFVYLFYNNNIQHSYTMGSLRNKHWIITTANLWKEEVKETKRVRVPIKNFTVFKLWWLSQLLILIKFILNYCIIHKLFSDCLGSFKANENST